MKTFRFLAIVALAVVFSACCACRRGKSQIPLQGTEWKLAQLYGAPIDSDNFRMTLTDDGRVSGVGECNRFTGTYIRPGTSLLFGADMVTTKMMCLVGIETENRFFEMFPKVDGYSIDGQRLMLLQYGNVIAIFDPAPVDRKP